MISTARQTEQVDNAIPSLCEQFLQPHGDLPMPSGDNDAHSPTVPAWHGGFEAHRM
jgi:hypothetical protein